MRSVRRARTLIALLGAGAILVLAAQAGQGASPSSSAQAIAGLPTAGVVTLAGTDPRGSGDPKLSYHLNLLADAAERGVAAGRPLTAGNLEQVVPPELQALIAADRLRLTPAGEVQVYVLTGDTARAAQDAIVALRARIERVDERLGMVQAEVPASELRSVAALSSVRRVRLPDYPEMQAGAVTSEGDALLNADDVRAQLPGTDGTGVIIGIISNGVGGLSDSQGTGDLPAVDTTTCNVVAGDPGALGAEGTALLEIAHDVAPGAALMFGNFGFGTGLDFNAAVSCLARHADIVVDDVGFFGAGPYNGLSYISNNTATALNGSGVIRGYYTAVGNQAINHYEALFTDSTMRVTRGASFWTLNQFSGQSSPFVTQDAGLVPAPTSFNRFRLGPGATASIVLTWNDQWGASSNDYDLLIGDGTGIVVCGANIQNGYGDPVENCSVSNPGAAPVDIDIYIANFRGAAAPRMLDLYLLCSDCPVLTNNNTLDFTTAGGSVGNQADATGYPAQVMAIGAVRYSSSSFIERYSAHGPTEDGRVKPDLVAPDGVCVTGAGGFPSSAASCQTIGRRFFGTSAAVPHIAGIAALLLQCQPSLDRIALHDLLIGSTVDLGEPGPDEVYGYGRADALAAVKAAGFCGQPTPTPTPTPSPTATPTPTSTRTPTSTPTRAEETVTPTATAPLLPGDANCDGSVNALDAALVLQFGSGLITTLPCPQNADANRNGAVDSVDAALILQLEAGLIVNLPPAG